MNATLSGPAPGLFPIVRRRRRPSVSLRGHPEPVAIAETEQPAEQPPVKPVMTPRERMLKIHEDQRRKKFAAQQLAAGVAANG